MTPVDKALAVLSLDPLPDDAFTKISQFMDEAGDAEVDKFKLIWEGFRVAGGVYPEDRQP